MWTPSLKTGPTLIGIGVQKCATSWLHMALGAHPDIGVTHPKELDFFSYYYDRGAAWYERFFTPLRAQSVRAELSPSYFHDPRAPERLHAYNPDIRLLVALRDPVARAWSNHLHEIIKGHIPAISFADGLRNNPAYLEQSRYLVHLDRWFAPFPREQIHVVLAEDLRDSMAEQVRVLYRFAGVAPDAMPQGLHERRNISDLPRSPTLRRLLRHGGDGLRRAGAADLLTRIKRSAPVTALLRANSLDPAHLIPPMDAASRAQIEAAVAADLPALARLLGRRSLPWPTWERTQSHEVHA